MRKEATVITFVVCILLLPIASKTQVSLVTADLASKQAIVVYSPTQNATYINNMQITFLSTFTGDGWFIIDNGTMNRVRETGVDLDNYTNYDDTIWFSDLNLGN